MNPERWEQIGEVLEKTLALNAGERGPYLDKVCAEDSELRREVESLLASHEEAGSRFLNVAAVDPGGKQGSAERVAVRPGRRIGPYLVVKEIGRGGMGEVFSAVRADGQYEKKVAIKLVRSGYDTKFILERFRNERQILASLDHPNIARLLDGGNTEEGIPYLAMELVEGIPIDEYCDARKLSVTKRLQLFCQVCGAVQYAHQRLVIHRDLKPSNILVGEDGVPKLLDFGIAKILDASGSTEATLLRPMTPEYASPEQIRGEPITTATDAYSLGVVLYQLLTGRFPYRVDTRTPGKLAEAITHDEPERPSTSVQRKESVLHSGELRELTPEIVSGMRDASPLRLQRRLRGDLDFILLKALRKEPARRYASVEQFAEDIRNHLEGLPVTARKGTRTYRAGKFIRRHRAGVAAAGLVLVTLVSGVVATLREARIAEANRRRAEARFNDVRSLANDLIFEVHDSIAALPGATQARKVIVQKSLKYLDGLSRESTGDISLQRELAAAYEKVGSVQGNGFEAHLGDTTAALDSYRKALSIRRTVAVSLPGSLQDQIALSRTCRLLGGVQWISLGDTTSGLISLKESVTILEAAAKPAPPSQPLLVELAESYERLGDVQAGNGPRGSGGEFQAGMRNHRKALLLWQGISSTAPENLAYRRDYARAYIGVGDDLVKIGERGEALTNFRKALEIMRPLAENSNNTLLLGHLSSCYSRIGDALVMSGKPADAVEYFRVELQIVDPLVAADRKNIDMQTRMVLAKASIGNALVESNHIREGSSLLVQALSDAEHLVSQSSETYNRTILAFVQTWVGEAREKAGKIDDATAHYTSALKSYSTIAAEDPKDLEDAVNASAVTGHLGRASLRKADLRSAAAHYGKALELASSASLTDSENMQVLYAVADSFAGLGDVAVARAHRATSPVEGYEHWKEARASYRESRDAWSKISNPSSISPNGFEVIDLRHVTNALARCEKTLTHLPH